MHILSRSFGRHIAQIGNADAAREPTFDCGFDQKEIIELKLRSPR